MKKFKSAFFIVGVFVVSINNTVSANANFEGLKKPEAEIEKYCQQKKNRDCRLPHSNMDSIDCMGC